MLTYELVVLCLASFGAGFVDSIVGGGGLIQLPVFLTVLPGHPVVTLLGTNKLVSVSGTALSAYRFSRQVRFVARITIPAVICAFAFSFFGAWVVTQVSNEVLKPVFMTMLFFVFLLTVRNKDFGILGHDATLIVPVWKPVIIGSVLGFYDGFFGPGMGSFLIIAFVGVLGMTFVQGSAYAKLINLTSNVAALAFFSLKGQFLLEYALPMMVFNMSGAFLGVRLALLKGNIFVRGLLRLVVFATILRLAFDLYFKS